MWFLILALGLLLPRVTTLILYFFTRWFDGVFSTMLWPILGFIFMPYTMLWYSAVVNWNGGQWGAFQILVLVIAVIADLSSNKSTVQ